MESVGAEGEADSLEDGVCEAGEVAVDAACGSDWKAGGSSKDAECNNGVCSAAINSYPWKFKNCCKRDASRLTCRHARKNGPGQPSFAHAAHCILRDSCGKCVLLLEFGSLTCDRWRNARFIEYWQRRGQTLDKLLRKTLSRLHSAQN